jgi:DNA modification methylase
MEGQELADLADDIREHGLLNPVVLVRQDGEELVLDGRNRLRACTQAGVVPIFEVWTGKGSPTDWVVSQNLHRRHLNESQRAMVAAGLESILRGEANDSNLHRGRSIERAASMLNVSVGSVHNAGRVIEDGAPELVEAVRRGDVAVSTAAVLSSETPERQREVVARGEEEIRKAAKEIEARRKAERHADLQAKIAAANSAVQAQLTRDPAQPVIRLQGALDFLASVEPGSADLLLTDPPYMTDIDDIEKFVESWVELALSRLKPTGRAYIFTGAYPREIKAYLDVLLDQSAFTLGNLMAWTYKNTLGPSPVLDYKLNWQAIFYLRGPEAEPLDAPILLEKVTCHEMPHPARSAERLHSWQKPDELGERFIRHATVPGQIVIDPFAGSGTFLAAAGRLGRRAIGCDLDEEAVKLAVFRGCARETVKTRKRG